MDVPAEHLTECLVTPVSENTNSNSVPGPRNGIYNVNLQSGRIGQDEQQSPISENHIRDDPERGSEPIKRGLLYKVHERCPLHLGLVYGFQQLAESAASMVGTAGLIHLALCGGHDTLKFAELMNAMLFTMGVCTLLEILIGFRLPLMEGPSFAFLAPILAMRNIPSYKCLPSCLDINGVNDTNIFGNTTTVGPQPCEDDAHDNRLREVAGSVMCAGLAQILLGAFGAVGFILNFVSSLTVAVTIMMVGIGLFPSLTERASNYWPAALLTTVSYVVFALILAGVQVPLPSWNRKRGFHLRYYQIFRIYPSLFAIGIGWLFCYIMTVADALPDDSGKRSYQARTDIKTDVIDRAEWLFVPYPGRIGMPTFGVGLFVGFLGSVAASTFESMGDYYNFASACEVPPPPKHAVNRGIFVEGLCTIFTGSIGGCLGVTTYTDVAGIIPVTGVASRLAWIMVGLVFLVSGVLGKMTAAIAMCPDPVISGFNIVNFGMMTAMGLTHLHNVDLKSVRNLVVLAVGIMLGLTVPKYSTDHINELDTGNTEANQVVQILLTSNMFVGGMVTFIFDNIVPGTKEERGILTYRGADAPDSTDEDYIDQLDKAYGWPYVSRWMRRHKGVFRYVPFLPP